MSEPPALVFLCGGLTGKSQDEIENLIDDDAKSLTKSRYFGIGKDLDPTLHPHDLGETARVFPTIKIESGNVKWTGPKISGGKRLGYIEGEIGEEGMFLTHYNTHVGKSGWYWECRHDKNYNILVNPKGAIISNQEIFPGQDLVRK